jgi:DNA-binding CsgD family transcriptional regulator
LVCDPNELTYGQIADEMGISVRTVDHFRKEIFEKFHINSKAGLILFAVRWRLVNRE